MSIGEKIKALRERYGLSLQNVGDAVGVSAQSVLRWERGGGVVGDRLDALARVLHTTPSYLMGWDEDAGPETAPVRSGSKIRRLPVYESVSAGFGVSADDHIVGWRERYVESDTEAASMLYIRAVGDSMAPKIEDGDLLLVQKVASIDSGRIGVFLIDGEDGVVKQALYEPGCSWLVLHSLNPAYRDRRFEGDEELARVRVLGLVRGTEWV